MTVFIFWLLFSIAAGIYASNRGRSGFGWFLLSMMLSPLLGLIFLAVSADLSKADDVKSPSLRTHVKCPSCAEFVLPEAKVCKHCGVALVPEINHAQHMKRITAEEDAKDSTNLIMGIIFIVALFAIAGMISRCTG